jgi:hypothetical protein
MLFSFFFEVEFLATVTTFKLLASLFHFDTFLVEYAEGQGSTPHSTPHGYLLVRLTSQPGDKFIWYNALPRISSQSKL